MHGFSSHSTVSSRFPYLIPPDVVPIRRFFREDDITKFWWYDARVPADQPAELYLEGMRHGEPGRHYFVGSRAFEDRSESSLHGRSHSEWKNGYEITYPVAYSVDNDTVNISELHIYNLRYRANPDWVHKLVMFRRVSDKKWESIDTIPYPITIVEAD